MFTQVYSRDVSILKQYGDSYFKVVQMRSLRNKGFEIENYKEKNSVNKEKLSNNISRARAKVIEYGLCNPWDYFFTFTIDKNHYDRYNLKEFKKVLSQWIRDYKKKFNIDIKYLLIPEKHKDGAWHFHGFISGLPIDHLAEFKLGDKMGKYIADRVRKGEVIYNWKAYEKKFGFCSLEPIRNKENAVKYITKYINKDLEKSISELGAHLYFASQNLKRADELKRGTLMCEIPIDFENEHCKVTNFDYALYNAEELKSIILGKYDMYD